MRSPQKNNRARGRGRSKGNGNSANRVYESTGPEGKVRGTPQQIIEKYLSLARDSQTSGDRVVAENFLQHAEHYQRLLIQANAAQQAHEQRKEEQAEQNNQQPRDQRARCRRGRHHATGSGGCCRIDHHRFRDTTTGKPDRG
ncbi:MAG: DUF4167 domain-containing protein [Pseudomonadota bacterium]